MKSLVQDLRRALRSRWFTIAIFATGLTLWLGLGNNSYMILHAKSWGMQVSWLDGMRTALSAQVAMIALPALSAMPFAANAFEEVHLGVFRMACIRSNSRAYRFAKIATSAISGMLVQLLSYYGFIGVMYGFYLYSSSDGALPFPALSTCFALPQFIARMLCAGIWSCVGASIALMTQTAIAAYVGPLAISFCFSFIYSRFLSEITSFDFGSWMQSAWVLALLLIGAVLVYNGILRREMAKHA